MLSVLIPTYNFIVEKLVNDVYHQLQKENINWEIRCYEDGSDEAHYHTNKKVLANLTNTVHVLFDKNMGRAAIRNRLAEDAQYENLLFIDADMLCLSNTYIRTYIQNFDKADAVYGGIDYTRIKPAKNEMLRWKYGCQREVVLSDSRENKPYISLKTCNLLIKKQTMIHYPFDERLKQYGHEDTLHAMLLNMHGVKVKHIENAMLHEGLEDTHVFLAKTNMAMQNLILLMQDNKQSAMLNEITIVNFYKKVTKLGLDKSILYSYKFIEPLVIKNLFSSNPMLILFDVYKLAYLIKESNNK